MLIEFMFFFEETPNKKYLLNTDAPFAIYDAKTHIKIANNFTNFFNEILQQQLQDPYDLRYYYKELINTTVDFGEVHHTVYEYLASPYYITNVNQVAYLLQLTLKLIIQAKGYLIKWNDLVIEETNCLGCANEPFHEEEIEYWID